MKIYTGSPEQQKFDYYENYGDNETLTYSHGGFITIDVNFTRSWHGLFRVISNALRVPPEEIKKPDRIYVIASVGGDLSKLNFSFRLLDGYDYTPQARAYVTKADYNSPVYFVPSDVSGTHEESIRGPIRMDYIVGRKSGASLPINTVLTLSRVRVFVDYLLADLAISSTREAGFYDTTQYLYTATGKRVTGLGGYRYRTLEVELARTSHDAFQGFITALHTHGLDKPLWLGFDKECHSPAFTPYDGFKCTLENTEEIMLQGSLRKDFYKTKLKFREWID